MLKQLAVFVENESGSLRKVTMALHSEKINIYASASFDTPEFGILRMVVDKPEKAKEALTRQGFVTKLCEVIAVQLSEIQKQSKNPPFFLLQFHISIQKMYN